MVSFLCRTGFFSGNNFYCIIFAGLTGTFIFLVLLRGSMFYLWSLASSQRMFKKMTHRYAPSLPLIHMRQPPCPVLLEFNELSQSPLVYGHITIVIAIVHSTSILARSNLGLAFWRFAMLFAFYAGNVRSFKQV
jgi:hypothetical protein